MANYFRITAYHPTEDYSFIIDSHGRFKKLWQFSSYLISKGLKILEVSGEEKFLDGNIPRGEPNEQKLYLQACTHDHPKTVTLFIDGQSYQAVEIGPRRYVPDRMEVV